MRIGLVMQLHGRSGADRRASLTWEQIRAQVETAEAVGFDSVVFEDGLFYPAEDGNYGVWEAVAVAGAIAEVTKRIEFGPSVFNAVYRSPAMLAKIAETLDEVSGGRFIFGIGAGNTPTEDYQGFGFPTDYRYSRFSEAIRIIHSLMKTGRAEFSGDHWSADGAEMVMRGPRHEGPPIVIAAGGPKMLGLTAQYADEWNWWTQDSPAVDSMRPLVDELNEKCEEIGRDPEDLSKSVDVYSVDPLGVGQSRAVRFHGSPQEIADALLGFNELGVSEVRCDLQYADDIDTKIPAIEAMTEVVAAVQKG